MTSNVGAKSITDKQTRLGFDHGEGEEKKYADEDERIRDAVMADLRRTFKPEFLNRIDDIIVFHQLTKDDIHQIARNMLKVVSKRIGDMGYNMEADDTAVDILSDKGFDPKYGARPLRRAVQSMVEDGIAEKVLEGDVKEGDTVIVTGEDGKIVIKAKAA
jgi:ATP-dependent Clp protease ATP-binding subunit ClpC